MAGIVTKLSLFFYRDGSWLNIRLHIWIMKRSILSAALTTPVNTVEVKKVTYGNVITII